jgi:hypothetical protein
MNIGRMARENRIVPIIPLASPAPVAMTGGRDACHKMMIPPNSKKMPCPYS